MGFVFEQTLHTAMIVLITNVLILQGNDASKIIVQQTVILT